MAKRPWLLGSALLALALPGQAWATATAGTAAPYQPIAAARAEREGALACAWEAMQRHELAAALAPLESELKRVGEAQARPELRFWCSDAALAAGQPARALELLNPLVLPLAAVGDEVQARRAQALEALGRPAEAAAAWQAVLQDWPHGTLARKAAFALPRNLMACGYGHGASEGWQRALARHPQAPEAAEARLALADYVAASRGSARAVPLWRRLAAGAEGAVADTARARLAKLQAAGMLPPPTLAEGLAEIDRLLGRRGHAEAQRKLQAWQAATPAADATGHAKLALRRGQLLRRQHDFSGAREVLRPLAEKAAPPVRLAALSEWAGLELAGPQPLAAVPLLTQLAAQSRGPAQREARFNGALALYLAGQHAPAQRQFKRYAATFPRDPHADEAMWYAAWASMRAGASAEADAGLARLLQRYPRSTLRARAWYWRGRIAQGQAQSLRARRAFTQATADESGYYAMLARARLADLPAGPMARSGPAPRAPPALPGMAQAVSHVDAAPSGRVDPPPFPEAPEPEAAAGGLGASLAWRSPEGWRTAWLARLGLRREAAQTVHQLPGLAGASPHQVATDRGQLLCALGDYNGAMVHGLGLLGNVQGWPAHAGSTQQRSLLALAYPRAYEPLVRGAAREFSVSPALVLAIMRQESAFVPSAESTSFAHGLMQVMPQTGRAIAARLKESRYSDRDILAPETNVRFGAWYLMALLKNYHDNVALAIGAYNAGPDAMDRWLQSADATALDTFIENVPFRETRQYIKHVLVNLDAYRRVFGEPALALPRDVQARSAHFVSF